MNIKGVFTSWQGVATMLSVWQLITWFLMIFWRKYRKIVLQFERAQRAILKVIVGIPLFRLKKMFKWLPVCGPCMMLDEIRKPSLHCSKLTYLQQSKQPNWRIRPTQVQIKIQLTSWLQNLSYEDTEDILGIIS